MRNEIKIVDVAQAAGVSIATVSNVVNGKGRVSAATRQKIERLIDELGYTPNLAARNLKTNRSGLIGLVVPTIQPGRLQDNPFYWDLLAGVEEGARDRRFHVILAGIDEQAETFSFVRERRLDGLIVVGANETSGAVERIRELRLPTVFIDSYLSDPELMQVYLEDRIGGYIATRYLIQQENRRIALLIGDIALESLPRYGVLHERWLGYKDALAEAGIPYDPRLMIKLPTSLEGGWRAADQLIEMDDVTAIFSFSDISAMGLLRRLRERGKEVPGDYSVIGFDNLFMSEYTSPALTTVAQDILVKGRAAVHLLLDQIDGTPIARRRVALPVELIVRETTGPRRRQR